MHHLSKILLGIFRGIKESWLLWLCLLYPFFVYVFGYWYWECNIQALNLMAYAMQLGAFSLLLHRLNYLHSHYDPDNLGYIGAIKRWFKTLFLTKSESMEGFANFSAKTSFSIDSFSPLQKNATKEEIIDWLNKQIPNLKKEMRSEISACQKNINEFKDELEVKINQISKQVKEEKIDTRKLNLSNLGRELVAVVWLMSAVASLAYTNLTV